MNSDLFSIAQAVGHVIDFLGVSILLVGIVLSTIVFLIQWYSKEKLDGPYTNFRHNLARAILLGLEFLVAGDIIRSVAGTPTFTSVGVLAIIVFIRTFLGMTFELEINGRWPWQKKN